MQFDTPGDPDGTAQSIPEAEESPVAPESARQASAESTGLASVDEVLRDLEDLHERPLAEHVGAFERAHEHLRRALSEAGGDSSGSRD